MNNRVMAGHGSSTRSDPSRRLELLQPRIAGMDAHNAIRPPDEKLSYSVTRSNAFLLEQKIREVAPQSNPPRRQSDREPLISPFPISSSESFNAGWLTSRCHTTAHIPSV